MGGKSNVYDFASIDNFPLRVVVFHIAESSQGLAEVVGLFKCFEVETFCHLTCIFRNSPAMSASTVLDVVDDVTIHVLELHFAVVVESLVSCF